MREIVLEIAPGQQLDFAAALDRWLEAEPLATSIEVFANRVRVGMLDLHHGDGPNVGQLADDRPRAVALLRSMLSPSLVSAAKVDGRDWLT